MASILIENNQDCALIIKILMILHRCPRGLWYLIRDDRSWQAIEDGSDRNIMLCSWCRQYIERFKMYRPSYHYKNYWAFRQIEIKSYP